MVEKVSPLETDVKRYPLRAAGLADWLWRDFCFGEERDLALTFDCRFVKAGIPGLHVER